MERKLARKGEHAARARLVTTADWVRPTWVRRSLVPIRRAVRAARGRAVHLQHQGSSSRNMRTSTRAPTVRSRQAAKPSDVSSEGQNPRSSPSAGKPRTRRRGTVSRTAAKPPEKAMYVAPRSDLGWLRSEQCKLYARSGQHLDYVFRKLWGLVNDLRNLRSAFARVAGNRGARTSGVDGMTVRKVLKRGADVFLSELRDELRSGQYRPSPARRVLIPKPGQPGKFRPLGIPTVKDRVVQAAMKNVLEPIFEADFFPVSYGFRPGKSAHAALAHLRLLLRPNERGKK